VNVSQSKHPDAVQPAVQQDGEQTVHHRSSTKRHGRPRQNMQPNLSAMIDVIFLLLIYFVSTVNFTPDEGVLTAKLPQGTGQPSTSLAPPERPLNIVLTAAGETDCRIRIEGYPESPSGFTELATFLVQLQYDPQRGLRSGAFKPDSQVIIRPEAGVRWQHVTNAFNAAVRARYTNINFAQVSR
jgi:biopolymer transport protein ExbD